ncbi:MAG: hypothetical protein KDJ31_13995, partial [Candidatus Competibacteraceae bacterium]|nr:hypothetical protein [Candidatus Competibacteraceae bacterium]
CYIFRSRSIEQPKSLFFWLESNSPFEPTTVWFTSPRLYTESQQGDQIDIAEQIFSRDFRDWWDLNVDGHAGRNMCEAEDLFCTNYLECGPGDGFSCKDDPGNWTIDNSIIDPQSHLPSLRVELSEKGKTTHAWSRCVMIDQSASSLSWNGSIQVRILRKGSG